MSKTPLRNTARSLPIALLRARETVMGPVREMLAASGVNEQKWRVLRVLDEAGDLDQSLLAERACLQLPSLTRILRAMEDQGLVTRAVDPGDRRRSIVTISDAGRQVIEDHAPSNRALFARIEARFGRERMETLLDLLEELNRTDLRG
ncbi:MAG: homoprotocatechuate degradation operon regulator HpaR [Rhodobacteraceae bacterium]|nr:homoprotocatechuate degradation operon regulator HpaR [Paracoccaceae bacterium]